MLFSQDNTNPDCQIEYFIIESVYLSTSLVSDKIGSLLSVYLLWITAACAETQTAQWLKKVLK